MAEITIRCDSEKTAQKIIAELNSFAEQDLISLAGNWFVHPKDQSRVRIHVWNGYAANLIDFVYV